MAKLFISFIHEEQTWARNLQVFISTVLREQPFLSSDQTIIFAGEDWLQRVIEELKDCKVLISMLSPRSIGRPWINFEAGAAWIDSTRRVVPVCFDGLTVDNLPKPYSNLQAVDLETYQGSYYLVSSIAHHLELPQPERPVFPPYSAAAAGLAGDARENDKLLAPYESLHTMMERMKKAEKLIRSLTAGP